MQVKPPAVFCLSQVANLHRESDASISPLCCASLLCVCVCARQDEVGIDIPLPRTLMMSSGSVSPGSGRACRPRAGSSGGARRKVHPEDA